MRTARRLAPYLRRHAVAYALGFGCLLASNWFTTLVPRYVQQSIDFIAAQAEPPGLRNALALLLLTASLGGVLRFGVRRQLNGASRDVETDLRDDLFGHLLALPPAFHQRYAIGDLMARATNDLLALRMVAGPAIMYLVDTLVRTLMILPAMLSLSPSLTFWALLSALGLPLVMVVMGGIMHRHSLAVQDAFGTLSAFVQEHLAGIRVVRAYAQEDAERDVFTTLDQDYVDRNMRLARTQGVFHPLLGLLGGIGGVVTLIVGGRLVLAGAMTLGGLVAFTVYLATLVWPMIALGWAISLIQRGEGAAERLDTLFEAPLTIRDPAAPRALPPASGGRAVRFDEVWFRYPGMPEDHWVLRGLSFEVPPGSSVGIVGATGSGKSTIAELLLRGWDPDRGRILLDGIPLPDLALGTLRQAVGIVPQETFLFSDTLRRNVLLDAPDDGRLDTAAAISRLDAALPDLPDGWDTLLGERGINLSGGQRQRAAIARALVRDPGVLILDDALSAVDARTEAEILDAMGRAMAQRSAVIISHHASAVREADTILVLDEGRIVESGSHDTLVARQGRYVELLAHEELVRRLEAS